MAKNTYKHRISGLVVKMTETQYKAMPDKVRNKYILETVGAKPPEVEKVEKKKKTPPASEVEKD